MDNGQYPCILCGGPTANKNRVCDKCNKALKETFEANINNKTKTHDKKSRSTNRKM